MTARCAGALAAAGVGKGDRVIVYMIQKIADGKEWKLPATIDDPAILDEIREALGTIGLAKPRG